LHPCDLPSVRVSLDKLEVYYDLLLEGIKSPWAWLTIQVVSIASRVGGR
jgi:hypothetical protein